MQLAAFLVDWKNCGGSSFIELTTGINIAFVAWDKFQTRLQFFEKKGKDVVNTAVANLKDGNHKSGGSNFLLKVLNGAAKFISAIWFAAWGLGWVAVIAGIAMLYFNWSCWHDWLLFGPMIAYLLICLAFYLVFLVFCKCFCGVLNLTTEHTEAAVHDISATAAQNAEDQPAEKASSPAPKPRPKSGPKPPPKGRGRSR